VIAINGTGWNPEVHRLQLCDNPRIKSEIANLNERTRAFPLCTPKCGGKVVQIPVNISKNGK